MVRVILFFKETLSGWRYILYVMFCIVMILAAVGKIGDRKRSELRKQMKIKKEYDLLTGRAAAQAALEGKQVISYSFDNDEEKAKETQDASQPINNSVVNVEEHPNDVPEVLVLGGDTKKQ